MTIACALPIGDDNHNALRISSNDFFSSINDILKREIKKQFSNDPVEIGDKIDTNTDTGHLQLNVEKFSASNGFPVFFTPNTDEEVLDDKKITSLVGDFEDSESAYLIKKEDSSEEDKIKPTTKVSAESSTTTLKPETSTVIVTQSSTTQNDKLLKDITAQPFILTQV